MTQVMKKVIRFLSLTPELRAFKKFAHLNRLHKDVSASEVFLIESPPGIATLITVRLFIAAMTRIEKVTFVAYRSGPNYKLSRIKEYLRFRFSIEKTIGCRRFYFAGWKPKSYAFYQQFYRERCNFSEPYSLEKFYYRGILIGDLIYDDYLRRSKKPTIDFSDPRFLSVFYEHITLTDIYLELFDETKIKGIAGSNSVYHFAIPLRIAVLRDIPTYCIEYNGVARLTRNRLSSFSSFKDYKQFDFESLGEEWDFLRKEVINRIKRRFEGEIGVDMPFSKLSSFEITDIQNSPISSPKKRILVALHDFFDAPHVYGENFFPDFYIWLLHLGETSKITDYEWFLKPHPQEVGDSSKILEDLITKYPAFQLVESETSHHELIARGINLVLTVYGTIGWEYPYFGIPVINATLNNPHSMFNFSITPSSRDEYENLLLNLNELPVHAVNLEEIYRFYFLHYFSALPHLVYYDFATYVREIGGRAKIYSGNDLILYSSYQGSNKRPESLILDAITKFIAENSLRLNLSHFGEVTRTI